MKLNITHVRYMVSFLDKTCRNVHGSDGARCITNQDVPKKIANKSACIFYQTNLNLQHLFDLAQPLCHDDF